MENNKILINRINETDQSWGSLPPLILAAYDDLLEELRLDHVVKIKN